MSDTPAIAIQTKSGTLFAQLAKLGDQQVLIFTNGEPAEVPLVRFHSACVFGEGVRATDCDCGAQLEAAVSAILESGGVITYAWEEGRGAGIAEKMKAIALQQVEGIDTAEAFQKLGHQPEPRNFKNHVAALQKVFRGGQVRLASANPRKVEALRRAGIEVVERVLLEIPLPMEREEYLKSKIAALGHLK